MKYKLVSLFLASIFLAACSPKGGDISKIDQQVSNYNAMMEIRRSPDPDLSRMKELFGSLSDVLTQAGLKNQADLYMGQVDEAEHISPPMQGVEKTFQQALVWLVHKELDAGRIDVARAYYSGLVSTAERRGKYFGSETLFTGMIDQCFSELKSGADAPGNAQKIKDAIDDVYFLSVLYELEGITAKRGVDDVVVQEKQIEGYIFYDIIRSSAKDEEASKKVHAELAKEGNEIDIDLVKEALKIAFPEKSASYSDKF